MHQEDLQHQDRVICFFSGKATHRDTTTVGTATATGKRQVLSLMKQQLQPECQKRKLPKEETASPVKLPKTLRVEILVDQAVSLKIVYAYPLLPVLSLLPELQFYNSNPVESTGRSPNRANASRTVIVPASRQALLRLSNWW